MHKSTHKRFTGRDCKQDMADEDSRAPLSDGSQEPFRFEPLGGQDQINGDKDNATPDAHLQDFRQIPLIRVDLGPGNLHRFGQVGSIELYTVSDSRIS
jgi:hypothetical protein